MIEFWPFWLGGLALGGVTAAHWLVVGQLMAVSGRVSKLVDAFRWGAPKEEPELDEAALLAAMQAATLAQFGDQAAAVMADAAAEAPAAEPEPATPAKPAAAPSASQQPLWLHVLFFLSLAAGGLVSAALAGPIQPAFALRGQLLGKVAGEGPLHFVLLVVGGLLVGFGTRMAGGCTSGHGLCGVSRFQRGSLLATPAFFGAGIVTAFALKALA